MGWPSPAVLLFQFPWKICIREVLEVFVGEGVEFVLKFAREHPLDFRLPGLFFEPPL